MTTTVRDADPVLARTADDTEAAAEGDLLIEDDELLVEEISIDGMCGVY